MLFRSVGTLTSLSSSGTISDGNGNIRIVPIENKTSAYAIVPTDTGNVISITTGGITVPNTTFTSPYGQAITIFNNSASNQTIANNANVMMYMAGSAAVGNRTLAQRGIATIVCVAANTFVISGAGLS